MQIPKIVRRACFCSPKGERKSEDYTEKDGKYQAQMQDFFTSFFVPRDEYKLVLPKGHPLAKMEKIPVKMLESHDVHPQIRFTTWEDFAIMAMAEKGKIVE